jgi:acyl-CoA synthetase (AMP-forming)/AMP-acid ligase II
MINYQKILKEGVIISSSGTSGKPNDFYQTTDKLIFANQIALQAQHITKQSRIYTCCKITHAGGLLAQTLPALSIGAHVDIEPFNAYEFVKKIKKYTHTHITPLHAKAIMLTKGFKTLDLSGVWVTCGADPVTWDIIEAFVDRGATFMTNWGMSEVGPIAINTVFTSLAQVKAIKNISPPDSTLLGNTFWCDWKIVNNELIVRGDLSIFNGWYPTKDLVVMKDDFMFYQGRTNKDIDLWAPKKG